jgi:hypothetical protein
MSHGAVFPWDERFGGFDRSTRLWFDEPDPYGWPYPQLSLPSAAAVPIRVPQRVEVQRRPLSVYAEPCDERHGTARSHPRDARRSGLTRSARGS